MSDSGFPPYPSHSPYAPTIPVGSLLADRYRVLQLLGQGGFGRTYQAVDTHRFDEPCVLKEFAPQVNSSSGVALARDLFQREAGVLYRLNHPQIPRFREIRQTESAGFSYLILVQDFVEGPTYRDLMRQHQRQGNIGLPLDTVVTLLKQLLPVLEYLHGNGVIHRDISPANLIQRQMDGQPVLIDFGAVKKMVATVISQVSQTTPPAANPSAYANAYPNAYPGASNSVIPAAPGTCIGKQGFAPPEQFQSGQAYPHSDLYALGATALTLLTGREPAELIDPRSLEWQFPDVVTREARLASVLRRMVALRPGDRYPSATLVLQALDPTIPPASASQNPTSPSAPPSVPPSASAPTPASLPLSRQPTWAVSSPTPAPAPSAPVPANSTPSNSAPSPAQADISVPPSYPPGVSQPRVESAAQAQVKAQASAPSPVQTPAQKPPVPKPPARFPWMKRLGGAGFALALMLGGGFLGHHLWENVVVQDDDVVGEETILDEPAAPPAPQLPPAEQARKQRIWERQDQLSVPETYLNQLVNADFYQQHPELQGRKLSRYEADAGLRDEWDALAFSWLDTLEALPKDQRRKLGSYKNGVRDRWIQQINQKRLGSRALNDLVAVRVRRLLPQLNLSDATTGPQAQIWRAIAAPVVKDLLNGEALKRLKLTDGQAFHQGQVPLQAGMAHVIELQQGQTLLLSLDSSAPLSLAFYPPRSNQAALLPLSDASTWEGTLDTDGFYEVVLIANAMGDAADGAADTGAPVDYSLSLSLLVDADDPVDADDQVDAEGLIDDSVNPAETDDLPKDDPPLAPVTGPGSEVDPGVEGIPPEADAVLDPGIPEPPVPPEPVPPDPASDTAGDATSLDAESNPTNPSPADSSLGENNSDVPSHESLPELPLSDDVGEPTSGEDADIPVNEAGDGV